MKKISLTKGKFALVDDEDFEYLSQFKWYDVGRYAGRSQYLGNRKKITIYMHKEILKTPDGMYCDHINHNRYDNRRINLRAATYSENNRNALTRKDNKSGYKGVVWREKSKDYVAYINVNKKRMWLKTYHDLQDAINARKEAEIKYHGEFALSANGGY